jgi:NAD-dependent deacetylase
VVWFGEALSPEYLRRALEASRDADIFLTVGTSGIVQPAASLPLEAMEAGGIVVEINPVDTPLSDWMTYTLRGPAGVILPAIIEAAWPSSN